MFEVAGLSRTEEAVYICLVRTGSTTVPQLAQRTGLGVAQVRRVVAALGRKGLVHRTPAPHERVVPVPADVAVEQLVRRRQDELDRAREAAYRLAEEARGRSSNRRTEDLIEIVSGRAAVGRAFERLQRTARQEMRVLVAPPYAMPRPANTTQLAREAAGISYRAVYERSVMEDPEMAAGAATHIRSGEQARLVDSVPTKLAVADRELALLPLASAVAPHNSALLVHPCGLLDALVALFETVWSRATPLVVTGPEETALPGEVLSADDRHLISLLLAGLTDEAAGARLGMSRRTVVRRIQHLMAVTGARSRIQLGWHARDRGWP
ncbi:helix-turn-helix domain-containing protein [Plantactinospora sp. GCM10030261]|uniref:helix-turn-helix domain-containing protein n=1 Tax=Plantactinospora sp. GCM10030261 TaxID=3273420 RepID=UPI00362373CB